MFLASSLDGRVFEPLSAQRENKWGGELGGAA